MLVIFSVYLLLAFSSFFFTGAADQSIIDSGNSADLAAVNNNVKTMPDLAEQLASYLINDCFGISSFFILVFWRVAGLKLMRVRIVRLWKWFIGCTLLLIWFSVFFGFALMDHYQDSFIYLGGMHGYNASRWHGFAGGSSWSMDDPADNGSLFLYLHKCTDDNLVAQTFCSEFPQTSEERRGKRDSRRRNTGVHDLANRRKWSSI